MGDKLKSVAGFALGTAILLAALALIVIFIKGALWASEHVLPPLIRVGWFALAVVLLLLLPLSLFKRLRGYTGAGIFMGSYVFGLICWLTGFVVTYTLWGLWAIILGLLFLGGGVVPIGMAASLFKGEWQTFGILIVLVVLTFGSRIVGTYIAHRAE